MSLNSRPSAYVTTAPSAGPSGQNRQHHQQQQLWNQHHHRGVRVCNGMTFVPTRTATNFPAEGALCNPPPPSSVIQPPAFAGVHVDPRPVCPFYAQNNCIVNHPAGCQFGAHLLHHQHQHHNPVVAPAPPVQGSAGLRGQPIYQMTSPETQQQQQPQPQPEQAQAHTAHALIPSQLSSGAWSNERKVRGCTPVDAPPAMTAEGPTSAMTAGGPTSITTKDNIDDRLTSSSASSVNLNDTFTRDPYEAQEKRKAKARTKRAGPRKARRAPTAVTAPSTPADWSVTTDPTPALQPIKPFGQGLWSYDPETHTASASTPKHSLGGSPVMAAQPVPTTAAPRALGATAPPPAFELPPSVGPIDWDSPTHPSASRSLSPDLAMSNHATLMAHWFAGGASSASRSVGPSAGTSPLQMTLSTSEPSTLPTSLAPTPKHCALHGTTPCKIKPGALTVEDLESSLLLPAAIGEEEEVMRGVQSKKPELRVTNITAPSPTASPPAVVGSDTTGAAADPSEQEGKFKVHRYRGPRHCRACRFHSKSLNSNVVLTRDLNHKYKLDMYCKVCDETIEKGVDDKHWQQLWDQHCKGRTHYRNSLEDTVTSSAKKHQQAKHGAGAPTYSSITRNGGASFNRTTTPPCSSSSVAPEGAQVFPQHQGGGRPFPATPDRQFTTTTQDEPATTKAKAKARPNDAIDAKTTAAKEDGSTQKSGGCMGSFIVEASDARVTSPLLAKRGTDFSRAVQKKPLSFDDDDDEEDVVVFMPSF